MQFIKKLGYFLGEGNEHAAFNIRFYEQLYNEINISDLYEPVDFFETARNEYLFFYHHSSDYIAIVEHFTGLGLDTPKRYYLLYYLSNLISREYADKENGSFVIRHEEVVLSSVAFINKLYQETKKEFDRESRRAAVDEKINHHLWQYPPVWDKQDFVKSQSTYKISLTTFLFKDEQGNPFEQPYYVLKKGDIIQARLLPVEYFRLLAYEVAIPQARNEADLSLRISRLKKIKSDFNTVATDIVTTDDVGKKYPDFFEVSEIAKHIDVYLENIESAMALKAHLPDSTPIAEIPYQPKSACQADQLTINQAALFCHYTGRVITRQNGAEIAREYGHTSGDALFNKYTFYQSKANRTGKPFPNTQKKLSNKIRLFETVAALLSGTAKKHIMADLNGLRDTYANEYT